MISPILANIYLHELDKQMEDRIKAFIKGRRRKPNKAYRSLVYQIGRRREFLREHGESHGRAVTILSEITDMGERLRTMPSVDMNDPDFKRLHYVRYTDDFLVGMKDDAVRMMDEVKAYVEGTLNLTISAEKSRLAALEDGVKFLG